MNLGVGLWEVLLILIVTLIAFGPGKMVEIARQVGKVIYQIRNFSQNLKTELTKETDATEAKEKEGEITKRKKREEITKDTS